MEAKINPKTQMLELSDGTTLPIPEQYKKSISSGKEDLVEKEKAKIRERVGGGSLGKGFYQAVETFSPTRGGLDVLEKLTLEGKEYEARKKAKQELSQEYAHTNPKASLAGTAAGIAGDIFITRKLPAAQALPLTTAIGKGSELGTNPVESLKDIGISAAEGYVGDKLMSSLSKMANRRKAIREHAAN